MITDPEKNSGGTIVPISNQPADTFRSDQSFVIKRYCFSLVIKAVYLKL